MIVACDWINPEEFKLVSFVSKFNKEPRHERHILLDPTFQVRLKLFPYFFDFLILSYSLQVSSVLTVPLRNTQKVSSSHSGL